ncbi:TlpA disulfide reductase family protein [Brachymonas sp. G13]|uniref:TlpA family protein disulfide reductase n=1 Tax=Brachymonas TaxID=28219 RepID=UPI0016A85D21|nr:TlpA disulfide reductase family protein [Brachymonas sp. J145]MEE1654398.1 TlpA disulfide reductase family protein [Brachymonas sp. J145]NLX16319.1 TlpA family protein disulfide reductase [Ramlibacter sp.]
MKLIFRLMAILAIVGVAAATYFSLNNNNSAPQSSFLMLDGSQKTTADWKGHVTLVNFWATSCTTCVAEMPMLSQTFEKYQGQGYRTVAVAMQYDPPEYVNNFVQSRKLPFEVALDNTGGIAKEWGDITITPTTFLLNKQGEIVKQYVGAPNEKELHSLIEKLLAS